MLMRVPQSSQHLKMKTVAFILIVATNICVCFMKESERINIGAYVDEENSQSNVPLNNIVQKNNNYYETKSNIINVSTEIIPNGDPYKSSKVFCSMLERIPHLTAIFSSESVAASPMIQSISAKLQLPYIQTNWRQSSSYLGSETSLNFHPDFNKLAQGLAAIVQSLQWKSFIILYENIDGLKRLQEVVKLHKYDKDNHRNNVVIKRLDFDEDVRFVLKQIKQSGENRIILDCELDHIMEVLKHAKALGIMTFIHSYFLSSLDAHTLDLQGLDVEANITTVRILNPEDEEFKRTVKSWEINAFLYKPIDIKPYEVKTETMLIHESLNLFMEAIDNLNLGQDIQSSNISCKKDETFNSGPAIISYMRTHYMKWAPPGGSPFESKGERTNFTLYLVEGNRDKIIAIWNSLDPETTNIIRTEEESYHKLIESLQKGKKIIASRLESPYLMLKEGHKDFHGNAKFEGYVMELMTRIAEKLNFSFEFHVLNDTNNDGIIREIVNQRALFGISDLTITPSREAVVDFSMPFMRLGIGILLKKPASSVSMFAFLNPLSAEVWMYTLTLYLTISVILYFVARMAPGDWENPHPCNLTPDELENIWSINNCLWLTMGSIMNQGSDILPKGISSRLVTSMWWFFALIMTNSYIASLAAFLTSKDSVIDDLEDLAKQNRIKYGTVAGGSTHEFFRQSNYSTYKRMYANMMLSKPSVFVGGTSEGIRRVRSTNDGLYAFLTESTNIDYLLERDCDLTSVDKWFNNKEYGIAMPIDCPYRTAVNDAILLLQQNGTLSELKTTWWSQDENHRCVQAQTGAELRFENVGGIFLVLGIGVAIALLLGIIEFLWTVRRTSVEEHITYWQAFKNELMFSLKVWISKKRAKLPIRDSVSSSTTGENNGNTTNDIIREAGSIFHLDVLSKVKKHFSRSDLNENNN